MEGHHHRCQLISWNSAILPTFLSCPRKSSSIRMRPIFFLFLGLAIPLLVVGGVDGGVVGSHLSHNNAAKVKRSSCSHAFILAAFTNACKGKRSHGQKPVAVGQQPGMSVQEEKEVLEILSNSLYLYETWTQHGKREEESTPTTTKEGKTTPTEARRRKKAASHWRRASPSTTTDLYQNQQHQEEQPNPTENEVEVDHENDAEDILSPKSPSDVKMWNWMMAELEAKSGNKGGGGGGGRLRREHHQQVMTAVLNCCNFGCDASDFKC